MINFLVKICRCDNVVLITLSSQNITVLLLLVWC